MRRAALLVLVLTGAASAQEAAPPQPAAQPPKAPSGGAPSEDSPSAGAPPAQPPKKGFLGVGLQAKTLPGVEPPQACPAVTTVVPGSAAEQAGIVVGDELRALDGESLLAAPGQAVPNFVAKIKGRPAGTEVRVLIRRTQLSLRTTVDEQAQGPARDAVGPSAERELLPDLGRLLDEHPGRVVGVQARRYGREREVVVTLGARPGSDAPALPPNPSLRPGWARAPLAPGAALAERALTLEGVAALTSAQAAYRDLQQRLETDEQRDDPFRLPAVRYLHREPLRLEGATRWLGERLRQAGPLAALAPAEPVLALGRDLLEHPRAVAPITTLTAPAPGSSALEHLDYCGQVLDETERLVREAFAALSSEERDLLAQALPAVEAVFAEGKYLHTDEDLQRWERSRRAISLLPKVDRGRLLQGLALLARLSEASYLRQLEADLKLAERTKGNSPWGAPGVEPGGRNLALKGNMVVCGSGPNVYRDDYRVVIDLGGDDTYLMPAASARPDQPVALLIDLGGDDRYQSTVAYTQGSAFMGVALLVDLAGNDRYSAQGRFAQGSSFAGAALLVDGGGDDVYRAGTYAQGSALAQGLAGLIDLGGRDRYSAGVYAQGFAGPGSLGLLTDRGGDDEYEALGREPSGYGTPHAFRGMSQGASFGFRHVASGGIGVLYDQAGQDRYEAGNFSQGGGYYYAWGCLIDRGQGDDRYEGSRYAQGWAAHSALGSCWDEGGDDRYRAWVGAGTGAAWDLSATVFLEDGGDDDYEGSSGFTTGAAAHNSFSLFVDRAGRDRYARPPGLSGPNTYHGGSSLAVFVDAGGQEDAYPGGFANGSGRREGEVSLRLDLGDPLPADATELLERLLRQP